MNETPKSWVPWYFVAFFGFIALVNAGMITVALQTHTGLVTDQPYEKGLAYNEVVQAEAAQHALGWHATLTFMPLPKTHDKAGGRFVFTLKDANGKELRPQVLRIFFTRPTQSGMDFVHDMALSSDIIFPARGLWEARVIARIAGRPYQYAKRVVIP
jgi:nitrogen fixation protein FixH